MSRADSFVREGGDQVNPSYIEQREPLLSTKLFIPPLRPNCMNRPRLDERMNSGLDKTLILVSAPAGYGKTTLVSSWLQEAGITATWLSLDEDDNDPIRFLQYFISALLKIAPTIKLDLLGVLQDNRPGSYKFLLNILINEIAGRVAPFILVLDDFHAIHAQPVLEMLAHLIDHVPPQMHLVCLTRTDPPLPLARLRARNQLVEIRAAQLRFTQPEIIGLLNETLALKLSASDIAALEARLESLAAEQARLAAEQGQAAGEAARAEEGAAGDRKLLEETAAVLEQARARFRALEPSAPPAPAAPRDPTRLAEAVGGFFRSLEIQAGRLREVGAAETEIPRQGGALPVLLLRLGEAVRLWRGLDGKEAGWLDASGQPHPLPPALADLGAGVGKAVEMLRRRRGPALITLPIPVAAGEEKR